MILLHNNQYFSEVAKTSGKSGGWLQVKMKSPSVSPISSPVSPTNSVASAVAETLTDVGAEVVQSPEVLDMPVDPNEPIYCLCAQVSYGKMIGCDNKGVSILILI